MIDVRVQSADFDAGRQLARLGDLKKGGVAGFVGRVEVPADIVSIHVDHHPALARAELERIAGEASARWPLAGIILIHRHGKIQPGGRAFFVGSASSDAEAATEGCDWMVRQVRARAPFWRKDLLADGSGRWFEPGRATNGGTPDKRGAILGPRPN